MCLWCYFFPILDKAVAASETWWLFSKRLSLSFLVLGVRLSLSHFRKPVAIISIDNNIKNSFNHCSEMKHSNLQFISVISLSDGKKQTSLLLCFAVICSSGLDIQRFKLKSEAICLCCFYIMLSRMHNQVMILYASSQAPKIHKTLCSLNIWKMTVIRALQSSVPSAYLT